MNRRDFLLSTSGLVIAPTAALALRSAHERGVIDGDDMPVTGIEVPTLKPLDERIQTFMRENKVPGGAFAIVDAGRLIYARGYGYGDIDKKTPFRPQSFFRLASMVKPMTALTVLRLIDEGKLTFETKVFDYLNVKPLNQEERLIDTRISQITIRQCLQMTAGWDRDKSGNKAEVRPDLATRYKLSLPYGAADNVRLIFGDKLDFDPGTRQVYSNECYLVLGRVVEKATGMSFINAVKKYVAVPLKMTSLEVARSRPADRREDEVSYYEEKPELFPSLFPADKGKLVTRSDGAVAIESGDSCGGLGCSLVDLARFVACVNSTRLLTLLPDRLVNEIAKPPKCYADTAVPQSYYGLGWFLFRDGPYTNFVHGGVLHGLQAGIGSRGGDGKALILVFNYNKRNLDLIGQFVVQLHFILNGMRKSDFPDRNLFVER